MTTKDAATREYDRLLKACQVRLTSKLEAMWSLGKALQEMKGSGLWKLNCKGRKCWHLWASDELGLSSSEDGKVRRLYRGIFDPKLLKGVKHTDASRCANIKDESRQRELLKIAAKAGWGEFDTACECSSATRTVLYTTLVEASRHTNPSLRTKRWWVDYHGDVKECCATKDGAVYDLEGRRLATRVNGTHKARKGAVKEAVAKLRCRADSTASNLKDLRARIRRLEKT